ncbi:MAG: hypothetical protein K8S56_01045 [Candidatus Cloacimonetes bacterium]|nr:hypothetical protein [Candidatus Cloacimonadota bacterium]
MKNITLIIVCLLLFSCAVNSGREMFVESHGAKELKTGQFLTNGYYLGISRPFSSETEAIANALLDARLQIVQSLGVKVEIDALSREIVINKDDEVTTYTEDNFRSRIYAGHIIQAKPAKVYYERWSRQLGTGIEYYYKAWVLVPFRQDQYNRIWQQVLTYANNQIEEYTEMYFASDMVPATIKHLFNILTFVIDTERDLQNTMMLMNMPEYQKFLRLKRELTMFVEAAVREIRIYDLDSSKKFRDELRLYVSYRKMAMPQFPITITAPDIFPAQTVVTDGHGKAVIPFQYRNKRDALVSIRSGTATMQPVLTTILPATEIVLLSPLNTSNIDISLQIRTVPLSPYFASSLSNELRAKGYSIVRGENSVPDFTITGTFTSRQITDKRYDGYDIFWAESTLNLKLNDTRYNHEILSYHLPDGGSYTDTRGVGKTLQIAHENSLKLSNMNLRGEMMAKLAEEIDKAIGVSFGD